MNSPPSRKRIDLDALSSNIDSVSAIDPVARPLARLAGVVPLMTALLIFLANVVLTLFIVVCLASAGSSAKDAKKPMIFLFGNFRWQINLAY